VQKQDNKCARTHFLNCEEKNICAPGTPVEKACFLTKEYPNHPIKDKILKSSQLLLGGSGLQKMGNRADGCYYKPNGRHFGATSYCLSGATIESKKRNHFGTINHQTTTKKRVYEVLQSAVHLR
jgi:hypothetical protein